MKQSDYDKALKLLRNFTNTFSINQADPLSGVQWNEFSSVLIRDPKFSEFDEDSIHSFIRQFLPLDDIYHEWDGSQQKKDALYSLILAIIESHPREYTFYMGLVMLEPFAGYRIELAPGVVLYTDDERPHEGGPNGSKTWLKIDVNGFVPMFGKGSAHESYEAILKQVAYFLLLDPRFGQGYYPGIPPHVFYRKSAEQILTLPPDSSLLRLLGRFRILPEHLIPEGLLDWPLDTPEKRSLAFARGWERAKLFFGLPDGEAKAQLAAAMEWYVDSYLDFNETVSYLKACIGIESLLGDSKEQMHELSRRLEDRYAFMIGTNRAERDALALSMKKVLNLRGELVHARKRKLTREQRPLLQNVKVILAHCINHELNTLRPIAS